MSTVIRGDRGEGPVKRPHVDGFVDLYVHGKSENLQLAHLVVWPGVTDFGWTKDGDKRRSGPRRMLEFKFRTTVIPTPCMYCRRYRYCRTRYRRVPRVQGALAAARPYHSDARPYGFAENR